MAWAQTAYQVSQCRSCRSLDVERTAAVPAAARPRQRARAAAARAGGDAPDVRFAAAHSPLRRDGRVINDKWVHPRYVEEGLQLKLRRQRQKAATLSAPRTMPTQPNERWAMGVGYDVLNNGRAIRVFTVVSVCTRECVALHAEVDFEGSDVAAFLSAASAQRGGVPAVEQCDNGTELTSTALEHWADGNLVRLDFSRPGKPVDNCACEGCEPRVVSPACSRRAHGRSRVSQPRGRRRRPR